MNQRFACFEDPFHRDGAQGHNTPAEVNGSVYCVSHGTPSPLIRWHYHDDFELHLVVATSGKFFVGDHIGVFHPGNFVLTGSRLPHNWISSDVPAGGVALRDHCILFSRTPIEQSSYFFPELKEVLQLLDRAARGIEFFGFSDVALGYFERIASSKRVSRLGHLFEFLDALSHWSDFRLLSGEWSLVADDNHSMAEINTIINYISEHFAEPLVMSEVARQFHMSESHFSRSFHRRTGNTFTDFLIRVRITRACQLLIQTDENISLICYDAGFNNVANFNRRFLEIKGMTPTEYRQQTRSQFD